jgi:PilZ domain
MRRATDVPPALNLPIPSADMLTMNQRRELRIETEQSVWVTIFGEPDIHVRACIKNVSARGVGLQLQDPVAVGAALKITLDDALLLGEVIYCRDDEASFYVGVELEHSLCGLRDLAAALGSCADSTSSPQKTHAVVESRYEN